MPRITFRVTTNVKPALDRLGRMKEKATRFPGLNYRIYRYMQASIDKTFNEEGVPAGLWRQVTRYGQSGIPRKILTVSGTLRDSIHSHAEDHGAWLRVSYYSRRIYAGIHQFGGVIRARRKPYLVFQVWTPEGFVWRRTKQVTIPATPFLVFRPEDPANLRALVRDYMLEA